MPGEVSREEFDALVARVRAAEERQDAHAVVVAAALQRLAGRFDAFEAGVDRRFDAVDQRFDVVDQRMGAMEGRLGRIEDRLDGIDDRLDGLQQLVPLTRAIARHVGLDPDNAGGEP